MKKKEELMEIASYIFFGVLTTVVNYLVYFLCLNIFHLDYRLSNAFAWFFSVLFAYLTNKFWVFKSTLPLKESLKEVLLFYWYRGLSFVIDMAGMILFISVLHFSDFIAKTITQVIVIALNYLFSKLWIFKKPESK